jgi:hypothetical protein
MNDKLIKINRINTRILGITKDRRAIREEIERFETAGMGYYLGGTIAAFRQIRVILQNLDDKAGAEIETLFKKLFSLK